MNESLLELRLRLQALRSESGDRLDVVGAQLDLLEAAVEQLLTGLPALPAPPHRPVPRATVSAVGELEPALSPEDAFYADFLL